MSNASSAFLVQELRVITMDPAIPSHSLTRSCIKHKLYGCCDSGPRLGVPKEIARMSRVQILLDYSMDDFLGTADTDQHRRYRSAPVNGDLQAW